MWVHEGQVEYKGVVVVFFDEACRFSGEKCVLAQILRQVGCHLPGEDPLSYPLYVRCIAFSQQEVMIVTEARQIFPLGEEETVVVLHAQPLSKSVLWDDFVAQVPFSNVAAQIIGRNHLGDSGRFLQEWNVNVNDAGGMGVEAGHDAGACG